MSSISFTDGDVTVRRANDWLVDPKKFRTPEQLFDQFWREGELAMLFGPSASGKSVLAVQLGDALSRGSGLPGFRLPRGRRRVLYVDLRHTDEQFQMRCVGNEVGHKFPLNLFRGRPPAGTELCEWLAKCVTVNRIQVVIIDDLSAVRSTNDGTRETLRLMRQLREIRDRLGISILVIADSAPPRAGQIVAEAHLGRGRMLCTIADSVFAIGRSLRRAGDHYIVQTRVRNGRVFWTPQNAPVAEVGRSDRGLLALRFDERFSEYLDPEKRRLICEVSRLAEVEGKTFREIAKQLGISKSWVATLFRRWTPALDDIERRYQLALKRSADPEFDGEDEDDEFEDDEWDDEDDETEDEDEAEDEPDDDDAGESGTADRYEADDGTECAAITWPTTGFNPYRVPFAAALARRWIRDLEHDLDGYGREIFVESRREHDGKPLIWYSQNPRTGNYTRHERDLYGINLNNIGSSGAIPRS